MRPAPAGPEAPPAERPWAAVKRRAGATRSARGRRVPGSGPRIEAEFPDALHATLGEALARLIDYQDARYAERFLERVRRVRALDPDARLTERLRAAARRVDDLRGRHPGGRPQDAAWPLRAHPPRERGARAARSSSSPTTSSPTSTRSTASCPPRSADPSRAGPSGAGPTAGRPSASTSRPPRCWASCASGRSGACAGSGPSSLRRQREFALIERWERAVLDGRRPRRRPRLRGGGAAPMSCKGYGEVRRRLSGAFTRFLDETALPARDRGRSAGRPGLRPRDRGRRATAATASSPTRTRLSRAVRRG